MSTYQEMIVRYLEAEYNMPADKVIRWLHKRNRYSDIAETIGCSPKTLLAICKELGIDDEPPTRISYTPTYVNATDFLKRFDSVEDAVVECRDPDRLGLSVKDTASKLGIGCSTVIRHTPDYLKYTTFVSSRIRSNRSPPPDHPWRQ